MRMSSDSQFLLLSGSSHPTLAEEIAGELSVSLGKCFLGRFCDGEVSIQIQESVRGHHVFVLQAVALDPDAYLMELLSLIDVCKRSAAKSVTVVLPYFGYCRQDRRDRPRVPITAKLVANLLETAGATQVLAMDLHSEQLEGFFDIPLDNLFASGFLLEQIKSRLGKELVVVAPDLGSIKRARMVAGLLSAEFAIVDKERGRASGVQVLSVIGDVRGKSVLLADDMCTTGGTLLSAAKVCLEKGAQEIAALVTHGLFVGGAVEAIEKSPIDWVVASNSVPYTERLANTTKISTISVAPLFAKAIRCILAKESFASLYPNLSTRNSR